MRLIKIIGLTYLCRIIYYKKSFRAKAILLNGLLYHGFASNKNKNEKITLFLKYYDTICNILMIGYTINKYPKTSNFAITGSLNYLLMSILDDNKRYTYFDDILHVMFIQLPLFRGLEKSLKMKSLINI